MEKRQHNKHKWDIERFSKTIITLLLLIACGVFAKAQDIQIEWGKELKVVAETELHTKNSMTFLYTEVVVNHNEAESAYVQLFREQKFWEMPLFIHAEFKSYLSKYFTTKNIYMLGGALGLADSSKGFATLELLYRHDGRNGWQTTLVWGLTHKRLTTSSYVDFYGVNKFRTYSENRIMWSLNKRLQIGTNLEITYNERKADKLSFYPFALLKVNL